MARQGRASVKQALHPCPLLSSRLSLLCRVPHGCGRPTTMAGRCCLACHEHHSSCSKLRSVVGRGALEMVLQAVPARARSRVGRHTNSFGYFQLSSTIFRNVCGAPSPQRRRERAAVPGAVQTVHGVPLQTSAATTFSQQAHATPVYIGPLTQEQTIDKALSHVLRVVQEGNRGKKATCVARHNACLHHRPLTMNAEKSILLRPAATHRGNIRS